MIDNGKTKIFKRTEAKRTREIPQRTNRTVKYYPAQEEIAKKAYELYERRGCAHGCDWNDWFQAEEILKEAL